MWCAPQVDPSRISRIFILGPSHHVYLPDCALTAQREYETPLGNLRIDDECVAELYKTGAFKTMSQEVDEDEHSIEMHLPYIKKVT
jgi:AmmeMemoRadiSam system protein B